MESIGIVTPQIMHFAEPLRLQSGAAIGKNYWLVAITMINAAIGAAYYLKIVAAMFLRPSPTPSVNNPNPPAIRSVPVTLAITASVAATLLFGTILPATTMLTERRA